MIDDSRPKTTDKSKVVWMEISSFQGYGGRHYYGRLSGQSFKSDSPQLSHVLTEQEAEILTHLDGDGYTYSAGDYCSRFDHLSDVREAAVANVRKHFPKCKLLLEGSRALAQPVRVLACTSKEDFTTMNKIYRAGGEWDWDKDEAKLDALCTLWKVFVEKYGMNERVDW
jgi:hypothetical protein